MYLRKGSDEKFSISLCVSTHTIQMFGVFKIFNEFEKSILWSSRLHLFDQTYYTSVILLNIYTI